MRVGLIDVDSHNFQMHRRRSGIFSGGATINGYSKAVHSANTEEVNDE